jgi:hypothetical protein
MLHRTVVTTMLGASTVGVLLFGATSAARADNLPFRNDSGTIVSFVFAEPDQSCPSGMRDRAWFAVNPGETTNVQVNTNGRFILGAVQIWPTNPPLVLAITPQSHRDQDQWWSPPTDASSAGQCSDIRPNDSSSDPNAGLWHSQWNLSNACFAGGILGVLARPQAGDNPSHSLEVGVFCFVNGPVTPGTPPSDPPPTPL